jgi:hypothetical protein
VTADVPAAHRCELLLLLRHRHLHGDGHQQQVSQSIPSFFIHLADALHSFVTQMILVSTPKHTYLSFPFNNISSIGNPFLSEITLLSFSYTCD